MLLKNWQLLSNLNGQQKRKFGESYLVRHVTTQQLAVLKMAPEKHADHLQKEASFTFHHTGLPCVLEHGLRNETAFLILDYKTGVPLFDHWKKLRKKSEKVAFTLSLMEQLAELLLFIHEQGFVHLDVKPSNIIYNTESKRFSLIDFGLAEHLPITQRKMLFPLGYAAPELLLNAVECIGLGTDLYALATSVVHLWLGEIPNSHSNPSIMTNLQLAHPIACPPKMPESIFKILDQWLDKPKWRTVPTRIPIPERLELLLLSTKKREAHLTSLISSLKTIPVKEPSLFIKLFSKSNIEVKQ